MRVRKKPLKSEIKPLKKGKYGITVKTGLSPDELLKLAINTPPKKKKK